MCQLPYLKGQHGTNATLSIKIKKDFLSRFLNQIPQPGNIHWDGFIPHCISVMPIQTESTGSHSRKMRFAEIPVLFYLIISGCQSGRHKPLLRTFTGAIQDHQNHKIILQGNLYRGASLHEMGFCHPCPSAKANG